MKIKFFDFKIISFREFKIMHSIIPNYDYTFLKCSIMYALYDWQKHKMFPGPKHMYYNSFLNHLYSFQVVY